MSVIPLNNPLGPADDTVTAEWLLLSRKQRDRNHPFSFPQCRQGNMRLGGGIQYSVICDRGNGVIHRGQKPASRG